jgi:hypothetical protein
MPIPNQIDFSDANKAGDPDQDGLPGITIKRVEAQKRLNELATKLVVAPIGTPEWYDILYLFLLEYGNNLKYLNPVFAKLGGVGVLINTGLVYAIKYMAKRSRVKQIDFKNPENL